MTFDIHKPWLTLDPWQEDYIKAKGNCFLLCGRQSGKSAAASIKFGERAAKNPKRIIMMIALTEKQAYALFFKTLMYLEAKYPKMIKRGLDKPTKHVINLKNGSKIMCYAAGLTGDGLRTFTLTDLVVDEAAPMAREIFTATTPMLSVTGGSIDLLSTPRGKVGYFYECSDDAALGPKIKPNFTRFYVSAEDCPRHDKEHLEAEKASMSSLEYAQEYLAKFLDDLKRVFSDDWIIKTCTEKRRERIYEGRVYVMGNDIARMGKDESTFEILDVKKQSWKTYATHVYHEITKKTLTTETEDKIIELNKLWKFRKQGIGIDAGAGSLGVGVLDHLLRHPETSRKVVAINSRARSMDRLDKSKTKLQQEDLYNNLVNMGNRGEIKLLKEEDIILSLKSIQFEFVVKAGQKTKVRFFGSYTHIVEGLIRAAWLAKDKHLNSRILWC